MKIPFSLQFSMVTRILTSEEVKQIIRKTATGRRCPWSLSLYWVLEVNEDEEPDGWMRETRDPWAGWGVMSQRRARGVRGSPGAGMGPPSTHRNRTRGPRGLCVGIFGMSRVSVSWVLSAPPAPTLYPQRCPRHSSGSGNSHGPLQETVGCFPQSKSSRPLMSLQPLLLGPCPRCGGRGGRQ